jgi:hypothetical protein
MVVNLIALATPGRVSHREYSGRIVGNTSASFSLLPDCGSCYRNGEF